MKVRERKMNKSKKIYMALKRVVDFILSFIAIVILSPVMITISILIKATSKGPVLFKQKRYGKDREFFEIWKFRTMRTDTPKDVPTHMLSNPEAYITTIGRVLRKTSLDELPQLFNILSGKMAVIGPRPALWNQDDLMEERDKGYSNKILPGLTGWAQIHGRDEISINEKAKLDNYYAEHMNVRMDIRILFCTVLSVMWHDGVAEGGNVKTK